MRQTAAILVALLLPLACAGPPATTTPEHWSVPKQGPFKQALSNWAQLQTPPPGPKPDPSREDRFAAVSAPTARPGLVYEYFELDSPWSALGDFSKLQPAAKGVVERVGLSFPHREDIFAVRLHGFFRAAEDGIHTFALKSDDGSAVYLHGRQIVNNDGLHGPVAVTGKAWLAPGLHPLEVRFFENTHGQLLDLHVRLPSGDSEGVEQNMLAHLPAELKQ